jgi:hypothetical protein
MSVVHRRCISIIPLLRDMISFQFSMSHDMNVGKTDQGCAMKLFLLLGRGMTLESSGEPVSCPRSPKAGRRVIL